MFSSWKNIIIKVICILIFIFIFYKLTDSSLFNTNKNSYIETFETTLENEKINYIKLKETYIQSKDTSLELLYANYSGEEAGSDVWENKTLDQCTDLCNNIEGCAGFTRDLSLDTEQSKCYPYNVVNKCYSNRKGDLTQMQNAIKYNSFIKSNVPNILNMCIGDPELTLNRTIFIKSYSMPKSCLGISGDSRVMLIDKNNVNFKASCNFRLVSGNDGVGTVSFLHIDTGKYLFRDKSNNLTLYDISSGTTENKQRSSFNLYDSMVGSGSVMLKAMQIEGETTDKFITLDDNYLIISALPNNNKSNNNSKNSSSIYNNFTFYITDSILNSKIITKKSNMPTNTMMQPSNTMTEPSNTMTEPSNTMTEPSNTMMQPSNTMMQPSNTMMNSSNTMMQSSNTMTEPSNTMMQSSNTMMQENFTVNLDSTSNLPIYNNLFAKPTNFVLSDYLQDNYEKNKSSNYISMSNKYNDIVINNQLSNSLSKNANEYNSLYNLNLEIEKEISNLNLGLNAKNDRLINGLDKLRITDMANDYFFLQNISNKSNKQSTTN